MSQLSDTIRAFEANEAAIKTFQSQIKFYKMQIRRGEELLPQLKKQIEHIEQNMPVWKKDLKTCKISLAGHCVRLVKQSKVCALLEKRRKISSKLKRINREIVEGSIKR